MSSIIVNKDNLNELKRDSKPLLLDFYAEWCGPCRSVLPIIEAIAKERSDINVGKINVDKESALAGEYGVYSIPTLVVIKGGEVVKKVSGARSKADILALLN